MSNNPILLKENSKLMNEYNFKKNTEFNLDTLTLGSNKKIWWICSNGHEWEATVNNRKNGNSCPYCSNRKVLIGYNDLETTNPEISEEWNYKKNIDFTPKDVTAGSNKKVWWICSKGHEWKYSIVDRIIKKNGCPYCSNHRVLDGYNDLETTNPEISKEWNYKKNINLTPKEVTAGSSKEVWWICSKGHEWKATVSHRTKGTRCPICMKERSTSLSEKIVYYYIKKYFKSALENYSPSNFGKRDLDIYIKELNVAIEYDGAQFHKDYKRDLEKDVLCEKNNIKLYRIREPKCVIYNSSSKKIILKNLTQIELETTTKNLLKNLGVINPDVDIKSDLNKIYTMIDFYEKSRSLYNLNPELSKEWNYKKNGNLTPKSVFFGSGKKVWWTCPNGHEYIAAVAERYNGSNCPYCSSQKVLTGYNDLMTTNPNLVKEWNYEKNKNLQPNKIFASSNKKIWWICSNGHEWKATINSRNSGNGCPYCSNRKVLTGYNDLTSKYPNIAREWNYEKNKDLQPENVPYGSGKEVWWICQNGHEWKDRIVDKIKRNTSCPYCGGYRIIFGSNDLETTNPELVKEWDYTKNKGFLPKNFKAGSNKKVWWICSKGHTFEMSIYNRAKRKTGCPYCSNRKILIGYNDLETTNPELVKEWDYAKNGNLKPSDVVNGSGKKVWWICSKCNFEWMTSVAKRNKGTGCPQCKKQNKVR